MGEVSSTAAALTTAARTMQAISNSTEAEKNFSKKKRKKNNFKNSLLARLCCCCGDRGTRDAALREERSNVDYGFEDGGTRVILSCCSNTWSSSNRDLYCRINKNCRRFIER